MSKSKTNKMRQTIEKIIDQLADKSLTFGCVVIPVGKTKPRRLLGAPMEKWNECYTASLNEHASFKRTHLQDITVLGHPVRIGDVLNRMQNYSCEHEDDETFGMRCGQLCLIWEKCGFTKSLQEIFNCEWIESEDTYVVEGERFANGQMVEVKYEQAVAKTFPKDPAKKALAELLIELFLNL